MLEIREATLMDVDAIASLFYNTIRQVNIKDYSPAQIETWAGSAPEPARWKVRMETRQTFVALHSGEVVGFAELESDGHVDAVYVHHEHQGTGIASRLLERIEQEAERSSLKRLYTCASITARPFFERKGFVVVKPKEVEYRGLRFRNYRMEKRTSE
jgi:putative acetyltransferase